ncbi:MAG: DUF1127 domain-containing protein [Gammaproteobacteria bacterium]|nr:DUF1127 domain-containing protein [Gammaproteobacteria bacterium]
MNMFQFAIASIVDANTGSGLVHIHGSRDYATTERHGRKIRSRSIASLFALIKSRVAAVLDHYRIKAGQRRDLRALMNLNDHLLDDIGLHRGDLYAIRLGATSLEHLNDSRQSAMQGELVNPGYAATSRRTGSNLDATNEQFFDQKKCA